MGECTCKVWKLRGRAPETHKQGPHHEVHCPLWFDPTRIPGHAQRQIAEAETDSQLKKAMLDEDTCNEHCE